MVYDKDFPENYEETALVIRKLIESFQW